MNTLNLLWKGALMLSFLVSIYTCHSSRNSLARNKLILAVEGDIIQRIPSSSSTILIPYRKGDKWGFADTTGKVVIEPQYDHVDRFKDQVSRVWNRAADSTWLQGAIDRTGAVVIPVQYSYLSERQGGFTAVQLDSGRIIIDARGRKIHEGYFDGTTRYFYRDGMLVAIRNRKLGYLNAQGIVRTKFEYDSADPWSEGLCPVSKGHKWGVIDSMGNTVIPHEYIRIYPFADDCAVASKRVPWKEGKTIQKWGVIDRSGNTILPFEYEYVVGSFSGPYKIAQTGKWSWTGEPTRSHVFNNQLKKIRVDTLDYVEPYRENLVVFKYKDQYGFADTLGRIVIEAQYQWACGFRDGLAWVKKDDQYGFINPRNEVVVPLEYISLFDYVFISEDGVKVAKEGVDGEFYIDKRGREYYEP